MKTRLLKKLRREAKRCVKIHAIPGYRHYYKITRIRYKGFKKHIEEFKYPLYAMFFLPGDGSRYSDIISAMQALDVARRVHIYSRIFDIRHHMEQIRLKEDYKLECKVLRRL